MIDSLSSVVGLGLLVVVLGACGDDTSGTGGSAASATTTGSAASSSAGSTSESSSASSTGIGGSTGAGGDGGDAGGSGEGGATLIPCMPPLRRVAAGDDFTCALDDAGGGACRGGAFGATWQPIATKGDDAVACLDEIVAQGATACAHVTAACPEPGWYCFSDPDDGWTRQVGHDDAPWVVVTDDGVCFVDAGGGTDCTGLSAPPDLSASVPLGSIAGGLRDACAWSEAGITCWGDTGSLADDTPEFAGCVADIDVGDGFACVVYTGFDIVDCWGELPRDISPRVFLPAPGVDVAVGDAFMCVRTAAGIVRCWGDNARGALGVEDSARSGGVEPEWPGAPPEPVAIAAGRDHVAIVTTDGAVLAWGANDASQICDCEDTVTTPADASFPEP